MIRHDTDNTHLNDERLEIGAGDARGERVELGVDDNIVVAVIVIIVVVVVVVVATVDCCC